MWYRKIVPLLSIISWWHHRFNCNLRISPILHDVFEASDWLDKRLICRKWWLCCPTDLIGIWSNPPQIAWGRVTLNIWAFDIPFVTNRSCSDPMKDARTYFFLNYNLIFIQIVKHVGTPHSFCPEKWLPTPSEGCRSGKLFSIIWLRFPSVFCFPAQGNAVLYVVWCSGHVMNLSTSSSCTLCICSSLCFCKCYCVFVFVVLSCCVV